jgi:SAM-dependent methyltransferase
MEQSTFYKIKASQTNTQIGDEDKPVAFVGKWGNRSRIQITHEMLSPYAPFNKFLDLGCGNLSNLITLENLFNRGFGVDIAEYSSWKLFTDRFKTCSQNLDNSSLPFEDKMFDAVTILMVLEHVFDPFTVIEEIARVTKPEGYLVINVPNIAYIKHRFGLFMGRLPNTSSINCWEMREWDGGHIHYFTLERLTWLLEKFGNYQVLKVESSGKFGQLKSLFPKLLCSDLQLLCRKRA